MYNDDKASSVSARYAVCVELDFKTCFTCLTTTMAQLKLSSQALGSHLHMGHALMSRLLTLQLCATTQEFQDGPFSQSNLDPGASLVIAVPGPQGGVVVIGQSVIAYIRKKRSPDDQAVKSIQITATLVKVCQHSACTAATKP